MSEGRCDTCNKEACARCLESDGQWSEYTRAPLTEERLAARMDEATYKKFMDGMFVCNNHMAAIGQCPFCATEAELQNLKGCTGVLTITHKPDCPWQWIKEAFVTVRDVLYAATREDTRHLQAENLRLRGALSEREAEPSAPEIERKTQPMYWDF